MGFWWALDERQGQQGLEDPQAHSWKLVTVYGVPKSLHCRNRETEAQRSGPTHIPRPPASTGSSHPLELQALMALLVSLEVGWGCRQVGGTVTPGVAHGPPEAHAASGAKDSPMVAPQDLTPV